MSQELQCTPPELVEIANSSIETLIPTKSRKLYDLAYEKFLKWCNEYNVQQYTENVMLAYFTNLSRKFKSSTLWAQYSMIKSQLNIKHNVKIEKYSKLIAFIKRQGENYTPKKSKVLTQDQFDKFLKDAPNNVYLATKIRKMGLGGKQETEYTFTLPEQEKKIALEELREDDNIREQSLEQMREWIAKHPAIKKCRTDAPFLLRFLRTKKFSVPLACEMVERYLTIRQLYPNWFRNLDCEDPELAEIINSGYLFPLLEKDNGRCVLFSCAANFDPHKYTSAHMIRLHSMVTESLMDNEMNQIHGYTYVNDEGGFSMAHISLWSLRDIRNIVRCVQNTTPMRHKGNHFLNMNSSAAKLFEYSSPLLSEKLRNRLHVYKNADEIFEKVDKKILPKEYGGEVPLQEMVKKFQEFLKTKRETLLALDDLYIEIDEKNCSLVSEMNEELGMGIDGSFKKLTVD